MWARLSGTRHSQPLATDSAAALGARWHASPTSQGRRCSTSYPSSTSKSTLPEFAAPQALKKIRTEEFASHKSSPVRCS
jgi:hypothetical protein